MTLYLQILSVTPCQKIMYILFVTFDSLPPAEIFSYLFSLHLMPTVSKIPFLSVTITHQVTFIYLSPFVHPSPPASSTPLFFECQKFIYLSLRVFTCHITSKFQSSSLYIYTTQSQSVTVATDFPVTIYNISTRWLKIDPHYLILSTSSYYYYMYLHYQTPNCMCNRTVMPFDLPNLFQSIFSCTKLILILPSVKISFIHSKTTVSVCRCTIPSFEIK